MVQSGGRSGLTAEAFNCLGIPGGVFRQKFQGDETAEARVFGFINQAHASATEFFQNPVVGNIQHAVGKCRGHKRGILEARERASQTGNQRGEKRIQVPLVY